MKIIKFTAIWCPGCLVMKKVWNNRELERLVGEVSEKKLISTIEKYREM